MIENSVIVAFRINIFEWKVAFNLIRILSFERRGRQKIQKLGTNITYHERNI